MIAKRVALTLGLVLVAMLASCPDALALGDGGTSGHAGASGFIVSGYENANPAHEATVESADVVRGHWVSQVVCTFGGSALCADPATCSDGTPMIEWAFISSEGSQLNSYYDCPSQTGAAPPPQITQALVLRALRKVDLPASELRVQPPGGETLVNFRTNFFTDQGSFTRSVRLLGRRVDLKIWPSRFRWRFGDGAELASSQAGAPYPDLEITHVYESKGRVSPSVDTTYAAQFRVDGGPWRDVDGTVTIAGSPVGLRVRTARPVLVSYH